MSLTVFKRGRVWYLRGIVQGVKVYETCQTRDRRVADEIRFRREKEINAAHFDPDGAGRSHNRIPFVDGAEDYLRNGKNAPHKTRTHTIVEKLKGYFGTTPIASIGQTHVDDAVAAIVGLDAKPSTKNRLVIGPLTAVLNHNARRGKCPVPNFERPTVARSSTPFFEPKEALSLIDAAAPHLQPLLTLLFCTGARLKDALYLDWKQVNLAQARVRFARTKNGEARTAALPPAAVVALANMPNKTGAVFRKPDGTPYKYRDDDGGGQIKTGWRAACRRAGLLVDALNPDGTPAVDKAGNPIRIPRFTVHATRHSWATWFHALSRNLLLLKDEGGWKTDNMVTRYAKLMRSECEGDIARVWGGAHPRIGMPETMAIDVQKPKRAKK